MSYSLTSFASAELACLPGTDWAGGAYRSQLMFSTKQHHYEYVSRMAQASIDSYTVWVGLDSRAASGQWLSSFGNLTLGNTNAVWLNGSVTGGGQCAMYPGPNGG